MEREVLEIEALEHHQHDLEATIKNIESSEAVKELLRIVFGKDEDWRFQIEAQRALLKIGEPAVGPLANLLSGHLNYFSREQAAHLLVPYV